MLMDLTAASAEATVRTYVKESIDCYFFHAVQSTANQTAEKPLYIKQLGKYLPLATDTEVNSCFSIY